MKIKKKTKKKDADDKVGFAKDFNKRGAKLLKKQIAKNPSGKS